MKKMTKTNLLLGSVLSAAMMAGTAQGQVEIDGEGIDDEIVVTGSRIRQQDFVANSPVVTLEAIQFERTGSINTEQLLNQLPQTVAGLTRASNNPGDGTASVDLRGLGANRTLVLINGRRATPSGADGVVDINTIPPALIESVEALTGGASAVYGADAVSGVVNFILKDDFEGVEVNFGAQATDSGDAENFTADVTVGASTADGRGNAVVSVGYTDRSQLFQGDRDFSSVALFDNADNTGLEPGGSTGIPGAAIFNGGFLDTTSCAVPVAFGAECPEASLTVNPGAFPGIGGVAFNNDGTGDTFVAGGDVNDFYNYAPVNFLQLPQERYTAFGKANYEISDAVEVFVEGRFVNSIVPQELAPTPIFNTTTFSIDNNPFLAPSAQAALSGNNTDQVGIGARAARILADPDSPFTPQAIPAMAAMGETPATAAVPQNLCTNCVFDSDGDGINDVAPLIDTDGDGIADTGSALLRRRLEEVGPRQADASRDTYQLVAGIRGDISENFSYDLFYSEGRTNASFSQAGNVSVPRFEQALLLADADGDGNVDIGPDGQPTCSDPGTNGATVPCAPLNIFGAGNISPESAEFLRTLVASNNETEQRVLQANLTGTFGDLKISDSEIGIALGAEYIENEFEFRPSQALAAGTIAGFNGAPAVEGEFNVYSAYGELAVPLLEDLPFAQSVVLDLAGRVSDYSTVGTVYNYKAGGEWAINDLIRIRGNYNTAVRAPNIGELFSPISENFPGANDPCSASGAEEGGVPAAVAAVCVATGVPANVVGTPAINPASGQVRALAGGNPNLEEEEAETITIGAVISPNLFDGFTLAIDYYDIEIEDIIAAFGGGADNILSVCYNDPVLGGVGSLFCDQVNRLSDGSIDFISTGTANAALLETSGIDLSVSMNSNTDFLFNGFLGDFYATYAGTIVLDNEFTSFEGDQTFDCAGRFGNNCGEPDPTYAHFMTAGLSKGIFNTQVTWQYFGSVDDGGELDDPVTPQFVDSIGDRHLFGGTVTADLSDNYQLTLGVNNIFDSDPPIIGDNDEQANTYPSTYDQQVFGRTFFANFKVRY